MSPLFSPKVAIIALACAFSTHALAQNTAVSGQLANGLQYQILTVPSEQGRIDVRLQVGVGASDENGTSEIGVAHMVEHMVFRRAPNYPNGVGDTLIANGWRRGANFNAMTNYERTLYMFSPNKGKTQIHETLAALVAMMSPHEFSAEDWAKEQQVVMAEWRNGLGLNERMNRKRTSIIRSGSRQARFAIIGTQESINHTPVSVLQAFHARWYVPNNMKLMISGDISPAEGKVLIEEYFGDLKPADLPNRAGNYYEPKLQNGWHIEQIQDKDAGASQVAIIFRLDDSDAREYYAESGSRARLVARFAEKIISQRLRNQQRALPKNVSNVSLRKADIGRHTIGVGLFASVAPTGHEAGLHELLKLRAQILQQAVTQAEFDEYKATLQKSIASAKQKTTLPEPFGDAIQTVSENFFADKPIRTPAENAARVEQILPSITINQVNDLIKEWLNADDKLVQMQAPSLTPITLPSNAQIARWADAAMNTTQPMLLAKLPTGTGTFVAQTQAGKILAEQFDQKLNITRWTLQNGDKVIILQHPVAKGKIYWQTLGNSGFMQPQQNPWQTQLASQIVWQSAPQGWTNEQLNDWKKQHGISLSQDTLADKTKISGNASFGESENLLRLYHAYLTTPQVSEDYRDAIMSMARQRAMDEQSSRSVRENAVTQLRFGNKMYALPEQEQLMETEQPQLLAQWDLLNRANVTHYVLSNQSAKQLKPLVEQYLAAIPRQKIAPTSPYLAQSGSKIERAPINSEARSDVAVWSFTDMAWQPETAAQVTALRDIAYEHLKGELRDKALGVYSLKFETTLNPQNNRVESELRFATTPEQADKLWQMGETVLQQLPQKLTEHDANAAQKRLREQEKNRLQSPETWLNRLVLSETHFGDARYVQNMEKLPENITLDNLRRTAKLLWNPHNRRVLIADPAQ